MHVVKLADGTRLSTYGWEEVKWHIANGTLRLAQGRCRIAMICMAMKSHGKPCIYSSSLLHMNFPRAASTSKTVKVKVNIEWYLSCNLIESRDWFHLFIRLSLTEYVLQYESDMEIKSLVYIQGCDTLYANRYMNIYNKQWIGIT